MILLLGGTSETASLADAIARAGYRVLVSTATEIELAVGKHPRVERRRGRLDANKMTELVLERGIRGIVDATHPFASAARATASEVAERVGIPYLTYLRAGGVGGGKGVIVAKNHEHAAKLACEIDKPILLTIGSRNVAPYAENARRAGIPLIARVLDYEDSLKACRDVGIPEESVLSGRGPFSVEENLKIIQKYNIGVLVTKDSGDAGGVPEKLEAARLENCTVIVIGRPEAENCNGFQIIAELVNELKTLIPPPPCSVLALDLESVLVPEIWETVACVAGVPELAQTTRDIPDYDVLMRQRILLCREHGLTLMRLREIVSAMEPLPGAMEFLVWTNSRAQVVIISDTYHELADPILEKLGNPKMICNSLTVSDDGFIESHTMCDPNGKAGAVNDFQRQGHRVAAVGDSFNDVTMLHAADAAFLFRPAPRVLAAGIDFPQCSNFEELKTALANYLTS